MSILNESPVVGLQFSILSPDEIRRMSVVEVVNRETYVNNKAVRGESFWDMRQCSGTRVFPLSPNCPATVPVPGWGTRFVAKWQVPKYHTHRRFP